jgi:hypothetical protein
MNTQWRQTLNEAQMQLHTHPINQAREAAGQLTVNSVWPWGGGEPLPTVSSAHDLLWADDLVARGLARHLNIHADSTPDRWCPPQAQNPLVLLDTLAAPQQQGDAQAWREALAKLEEHWFRPLAEKRPACPPALTVIFTGTQRSARLHMNHWQRLAFWRRAAPLIKLATN